MSDHETEWYMQLTTAEMIDLASGYVPDGVRAKCLYALDEDENDRRRAQRPYPPQKQRRSRERSAD